MLDKDIQIMELDFIKEDNNEKRDYIKECVEEIQ